MKRILLRTDGWLGRLDLVLAALSALALLGMMGVTTIDVVMRYAFNAPLRWGFDLITNYLLVMAFFFGFSFALGRNEHVAVDFFARSLPTSVYQRAVSAGFLVVAVMFILISWLSAVDAWSAWRNDEALMGSLLWPTWPSKAIIPLGLIPLILRLIHRSIAHWIATDDETFRTALRIDLSQEPLPKE